MRGRRRERDEVEFAHRFTAKFPSEVACGHYVEEGETVAYTATDELVCGDCAIDEDTDSGAADLASWAQDMTDDVQGVTRIGQRRG